MSSTIRDHPAFSFGNGRRSTIDLKSKFPGPSNYTTENFNKKTIKGGSIGKEKR